MAVICLAVGIGVGKFYLASPKMEIAANTETDSLKAKLQELTDSDIAEYYRLRTLEERYKKADEILAKIMQIFLVDLGLRSTKVDAAKAQQVPVAAADKKVDPPASSVQKIEPTPTTVTVAKPARAWLAAESNLRTVRTDREIVEFLEKAKIGNFDDEIKSGQTYANANNDIEFLNGRFTGIADVMVGERATNWGVDLRISMHIDNGVAKGSTRFRLMERGKVFSNSRGDGDIRDLREFASGSTAVLLRASPGTYFQLYALNDRTTLVGNVYRRPSDELPFTYIGTVRLRKN